MAKVPYILGIVLMIVGIVFSYQNNRELASLRTSTAERHSTIKTELAAIETLVGQITETNQDIARVEGELDAERERNKAQKLKIAQAENELKRTQEDLDSNQTTLAELTAKLDKLPKDVKPETLQEDLNRIKQSIADLKSKADDKQREIDAENTKVANVQRTVDAMARKKEDRQKAFERNSMTATVVAVNSDWGFVIINAGEPEGISEATKLIVTRGVQTVGKISVLSVNGNRTIANIMPETLVAGLSIAPGDRVILENLFE
jgi:cell shape-determining protein MreC